MRKNFVFIFTICILLYPYSYIWPKTNGTGESEIFVKITYPEYDDFEVERSIVVKGMAKVPINTYLWVLVHRKGGFEGVWWPQGEAKIDPTNNTWKVTVIFGVPQDIGYEFEICVITVSRREHIILRKHWLNAMKSGDWRPITMPPTTSPPQYRTVKKMDH